MHLTPLPGRGAAPLQRRRCGLALERDRGPRPGHRRHRAPTSSTIYKTPFLILDGEKEEAIDLNQTKLDG